MELLGQKAVPFLVFWGNSILFSTLTAFSNSLSLSLSYLHICSVSLNVTKLPSSPPPQCRYPPPRTQAPTTLTRPPLCRDDLLILPGPFHSMGALLIGVRLWPQTWRLSNAFGSLWPALFSTAPVRLALCKNSFLTLSGSVPALGCFTRGALLTLLELWCSALGCHSFFPHQQDEPCFTLPNGCGTELSGREGKGREGKGREGRGRWEWEG